MNGKVMARYVDQQKLQVDRSQSSSLETMEDIGGYQNYLNDDLDDDDDDDLDYEYTGQPNDGRRPFENQNAALCRLEEFLENLRTHICAANCKACSLHITIKIF